MPSWLKIITAILGEAEQVVPIFIHNPKSEKIEGVVVTTLNSVLAGLPTTAPAPVAQTAKAPVAPVSEKL